MKITRNISFVSFTVIALLSLLQARGAAHTAFVLVCHASNNLTTLSEAELRKSVTGGIKQWPNGAVITIGIIPSDSPETKYLSQLLGTSPVELLRRIQEQVFRGEMRRPAVLHSSADCFAFARATPGGLCVAAAVPSAPSGTRLVAVRP
jgi:hypothetical protein